MASDRDAVTTHVEQDAAALPRGIPEPGLMRAAMLLRRARQRKRAHLLHDRLQLNALRLDRAHENLILEVGSAQLRRLRELDQPARFRHVACERFVEDNALELRAAVHRGNELFHDFNAAVVGNEQRNRIDAIGELCDRVIDRGLAQRAAAAKLREGLTASAAYETSDLEAADLLDR